MNAAEVDEGVDVVGIFHQQACEPLLGRGQVARIPFEDRESAVRLQGEHSLTRLEADDSLVRYEC